VQALSGTYLYNNKPVNDFDAEMLRKRVGYLQQHPTIFDGDVKANLKVAKPDATDAEMIEALKTVNLWATFEARAGLQTEVAELGRAISGGEAARLALARALLVDFDVLIFDEPTANLDYQSAHQLIADLINLAKSRANRAVILISHDADVIAQADRSYAIG
jgi:ATP-binding cassette subfamily C protein CydC